MPPTLSPTTIVDIRIGRHPTTYRSKESDEREVEGGGRGEELVLSGARTWRGPTVMNTWWSDSEAMEAFGGGSLVHGCMVARCQEAVVKATGTNKSTIAI